MNRVVLTYLMLAAIAAITAVAVKNEKRIFDLLLKVSSFFDFNYIFYRLDLRSE